MTARLELPDEAMQAALAHAEQGAVAATIVTVFAAFGVDLFDATGPRIRPGGYEIASGQWTALAEALVRAADSGLVAANATLDWVNIGPGSFDPAAVDA